VHIRRVPTLRADIVWRAEGAGAPRLDPRVLDLLRALRRNPTLKAAAEEISLSYRAAWGLLLEATGIAGGALAELQRGRGARLTPLGAQLLRSDERLRQAMEPLRARFQVKPQALPPGAAVPLRLTASHDPLLADFCERFAIPAGLVEEVAFRGSEESLAFFARGGADIAGFHFSDRTEVVAVRRHLSARRDRLVRFAEREQGMIVARGNPKRLETLSDVAHRHARFVNRQRGSGTRRLVDRLLHEAGLAPENIRGYGHEEYTHLAVAATVLAGRADAGLGVRAASAQLGLDFVPVVRERYWLAMRERTLALPVAQRLLEALSGKPLARLGRRLAGYHFHDAGAVFTVDEALA
jgi:putative molybdopterin biosynthesis protein